MSFAANAHLDFLYWVSIIVIIMHDYAILLLDCIAVDHRSTRVVLKDPDRVYLLQDGKRANPSYLNQVMY